MDKPTNVWLSGTENIYLVSQLLDPAFESSKDPRQTGRTKKLALELVLLALKVPDHKVMVIDHHDTSTAHKMLLDIVLKILDALGIDYSTGIAQRAEEDPDEFTGRRNLPHAFYVIAHPKKAS